MAFKLSKSMFETLIRFENSSSLSSSNFEILPSDFAKLNNKLII